MSVFERNCCLSVQGWISNVFHFIYPRLKAAGSSEMLSTNLHCITFQNTLVLVILVSQKSLELCNIYGFFQWLKQNEVQFAVYFLPGIHLLTSIMNKFVMTVSLSCIHETELFQFPSFYCQRIFQFWNEIYFSRVNNKGTFTVIFCTY
jgi:hypothetical protein